MTEVLERVQTIYDPQQIDQIHAAVNTVLAHAQFMRGINQIVTLSAADVLACLWWNSAKACESIQKMREKWWYVATPVDYRPEDVEKSQKILGKAWFRDFSMNRLIATALSNDNADTHWAKWWPQRKEIVKTLAHHMGKNFSDCDWDLIGKGIAQAILVRLGTDHFDDEWIIKPIEEWSTLSYESIKTHDNLPALSWLAYLQAVLYKAAFNTTVLRNGQSQENLATLWLELDKWEDLDAAIARHFTITSFADFVTKIKTFLVNAEDSRHHQRIKAAMINVLYMTYAIHGQHDIAALKKALEELRSDVKDWFFAIPENWQSWTIWQLYDGLQSWAEQKPQSVKDFFAKCQEKWRITIADRTKEMSSTYIKALSQEKFAALEMFQDLLGVRFEINADVIQDTYGISQNDAVLLVLGRALEVVNDSSTIKSMELANKWLIAKDKLQNVFDTLSNVVFGENNNIFEIRWGKAKKETTLYQAPKTITTPEQMKQHLAYTQAYKWSTSYTEGKVAWRAEKNKVIVWLEMQIVLQKKDTDIVHPNETKDSSHFVLDLGDKCSRLTTRISESLSAKDLYDGIEYAVEKMASILKDNNESDEKKNKIRAFLGWVRGEDATNDQILSQSIDDVKKTARQTTAKILNYTIQTNKVRCAYFDGHEWAKLNYTEQDFESLDALATHHFVHTDYHKNQLVKTWFVHSSWKHVCYHPSLIEKTSKELQKLAVPWYDVKVELLKDELGEYLDPPQKS